MNTAVYKSSKSGKYGYCTVSSHIVVWDLTYDEYFKGPDWHSANCAKRGWRYAPVKLKLAAFS